jgi:hypothetical protein
MIISVSTCEGQLKECCKEEENKEYPSDSSKQQKTQAGVCCRELAGARAIPLLLSGSLSEPFVIDTENIK